MATSLAQAFDEFIFDGSGDEESIEDLEPADKKGDPFLHAKIQRLVSGKMCFGRVQDVDLGKKSRQRLYRVLYDDGDLEHMLRQQVQQFVVKPSQVVVADEEDVIEEEIVSEGHDDEVIEFGEEEDVVFRKPAAFAGAFAIADIVPGTFADTGVTIGPASGIVAGSASGKSKSQAKAKVKCKGMGKSKARARGKVKAKS
eukprot:TRINITY_DN3545_c3_g1_i1.p1 TRINITY_DN3545_c3_g1~~TRINITY_DN3545_c3_g1_i1.p1  ORF type:complete len:199 (-),score=40.97 TRINITY_DN3545_c3_g1_i1:233-829(-)